MFRRLRRSPYRNYTRKQYRQHSSREKVLYIMVLTEDALAQQLAAQIRGCLGDAVRIVLSPASEYPGCTYLKILQARTGAERVITFGSIPGQYDVYVHDDGGNSTVKMLKKLYEGKSLEEVKDTRAAGTGNKEAEL